MTSLGRVGRILSGTLDPSSASSRDQSNVSSTTHSIPAAVQSAAANQPLSLQQPQSLPVATTASHDSLLSKGGGSGSGGGGSSSKEDSLSQKSADKIYAQRLVGLQGDVQLSKICQKMAWI